MPRGKAIMVQGTGSHVGKSVLCTALCRIFRQDGYRVAPFKAQNMANNAAVCACGGEIGRAQAEQAAACDLEPTVEMNPILLKPCSDTGSQVVVMGRAEATMTARQYQNHKLSLLPLVQQSLDSLLAEYDIVVIEGAGSPAEINLKPFDIVNMRTAAMAGAAVILVGDIDRGGVFAQLVGTHELLDDEERERICGYIINKFRGDPDILAPGLDFIEQRLGRRVLGVVPYLRDLRIADEDSVSLDHLGEPGASATGASESSRRRTIKVDVIRHSRIANFNDFDALGAAVRYIDAPPDDLPDAVILPGTKSTVADLAELRASGLDRWLRRAHDAGVEIVGICGGYQMLGRTILDPDHVESEQDCVEGLGLLDCATVFQRDKATARVQGVHLASGATVAAYEIHMGCTQLPAEASPLFRITERHGMACDGFDGLASRDGSVWGTYLHGVFDNAAFRQWWFNRLCPGVVMETSPAADRFDTLAAAVREHVNVAELYRILNL